MKAFVVYLNGYDFCEHDSVFTDRNRAEARVAELLRARDRARNGPQSYIMPIYGVCLDEVDLDPP